MHTSFEESIVNNVDAMSEPTVEDELISEKDLEVNKKESKRKKYTKKKSESSAARVLTQITFSIGQFVAGEEGIPNKEYHEEENITNAYQEYLDSKNIKDIPPGIALLVVLGAYSIRILRAEKSKTKLDRIKSWFSGLFRKKRAIDAA